MVFVPHPAALPAEASALPSNLDLVVVSRGLYSGSSDGTVFNYTNPGVGFVDRQPNKYTNESTVFTNLPSIRVRFLF